MNEIYFYALKLLRKRDYTISELRKKIGARFGDTPAEVIDQLTGKNFLNDRRYAENYVDRRKKRGRAALRDELIARGVATSLIDEVLSAAAWPSLREAAAAKMNDWQLRVPLEPGDAARLFRALLRLGYDEDAIREEIEQRRGHYNNEQ